MTSYAEALTWLYALEPRGIRLELDRMREALARLGNPERGPRYVHVAGTNGKGSTSAMTESILRAAGCRTGLYTSPHLHRFVERIRVDGEPVSEDFVVRNVESLRAMLDAPGAPALTFFEATTCLAFQAFRDAACDVVVLEVGLGGRLDATNVIEPQATLATAITSIGLDHQAYLGDSLASIAFEKAGIVKAGVPLVVGDVPDEARKVIEDVAWSKNAAALHARADERDEASLRGTFQRRNVAVVRALVGVLRANGFAIDDAAIERGLNAVRWPGRLELHAGAPSWLFDAAHNLDGVRALADELASLPRYGNRVLLFAAMNDKPLREMLEPLRPHFDGVIATAPATRRASPKDAYPNDARFVPDVRDAVDAAREAVGPDGLVVVAGSIYLLAEARAHVLGLATDPTIGM
jgi:dihydrofolate synthase/folylpolyglutamate synthase